MSELNIITLEWPKDKRVTLEAVRALRAQPTGTNRQWHIWVSTAEQYDQASDMPMFCAVAAYGQRNIIPTSPHEFGFVESARFFSADCPIQPFQTPAAVAVLTQEG